MSKANHVWPQGWSIRLPFDVKIGWQWTGTQGYTSRTHASLAGRHPRGSITWTWAVYWSREKPWSPTQRACMKLPWLGWLSLDRQFYLEAKP